MNPIITDFVYPPIPTRDRDYRPHYSVQQLHSMCEERAA